MTGNFQDLADIKVDQFDKVRSEYQAATASAKAERAKLDTQNAAFAADPAAEAKPGNAAYDALLEQNRLYTEKRTEATELQATMHALLSVRESLSGTVADGFQVQEEREAAELVTQKRERRTIVRQAVDKLMGSDAYKAAREAYAKGITEGDAVPRLTIPEVITREQLVALITRQTAGDNVLTGLSDTSAGAFVWPEQDNRFIDIPFRQFRVLDVVSTTTTDSDAVEYVAETSHTNAAAATLEATSGSTGALAESALVLAVKSVIVENIGHYIPATSRSLADAGQLDGILRNFLISGTMEELEDQVVGGNGSTPQLEGIYQAVTVSQAVGTDSRSDALLKAQTAVRVSSSINDRYEPDTILLDPRDMQDVRLEKDDNGNYIYGGPTAPRSFPIWGMRPVESLAATQNTPVIGDFQFAQLWVREGVSISVSDSNSDWFIRNILTLKAQMRAAFKVTRIAAFSEVSGF